MRASKKLLQCYHLSSSLFFHFSSYGRLGRPSPIQFQLIGVGAWLIDGEISLNCWLFRCFL